MVCEIIFCSEFPDLPDKAGRKMKRRRRKQAIAKRYAFHAFLATLTAGLNDKGASGFLKIVNSRSSPPEVFLGKGVLKIFSKFT